MNIDNIYAVIVLYNCSFKESSTVKTIIEALYKVNKTLDILVYDNSSLSQFDETTFVYKNLNCHYIHNPNNPGLAEAYNTAFSMLKENDKQWLLLLDQDTHFANNYFIEINNVKINNRDTLGALIPKVVALNGRQPISPMTMKRGGFVREAKSIKPGLITEKHITGINSGTLLSKPFLINLKEFDRRFPLDMLDHWYFRKLNNSNFNTYLLDTIVNQELSIHNLESEMSLDRYKNLLLSEKLFLENGFTSHLIFKLRLVFRLSKQLFYKEKLYFRLTLKSIFN